MSTESLDSGSPLLVAWLTCVLQVDGSLSRGEQPRGEPCLLLLSILDARDGLSEATTPSFFYERCLACDSI